MRNTSYATGSEKTATTSNTIRRGRTSANQATSRDTIMRPSSGRTSGASPRTTPNANRFRVATSPARATDTSTSQIDASQSQTSPVSRPDVEKSQTTATAATRTSPTGTTRP